MLGRKMVRICGLSKWIYMHSCSVANDSYHMYMRIGQRAMEFIHVRAEIEFEFEMNVENNMKRTKIYAEQAYGFV